MFISTTLLDFVHFLICEHKEKSSMNSGIHVLLAHYTWKGIIKSQFWLENYVLNATTLLTVRKKIAHIMQAWRGLFLFLCNIWVRKKTSQAKRSYSVQCYLLHFKGLIWLKATFSSKSNVTVRIREPNFYVFMHAE